MDTVTKAAWLFRFGKRLMLLHPTMTAIDAAKASVEAFRVASEIWPETAAEQFVNAHTPVSIASTPRADAAQM